MLYSTYHTYKVMSLVNLYYYFKEKNLVGFLNNH
jgi:hypothetical protein